MSNYNQHVTIKKNIILYMKVKTGLLKFNVIIALTLIYRRCSLRNKVVAVLTLSCIFIVDQNFRFFTQNNTPLKSYITNDRGTTCKHLRNNTTS